MKNRVRVIQLIFLFWSAVLLVRLGYWQIIKSSELRKQAFAQYGSQTTLTAPRGSIFFADGFPLVANQNLFMAYTNPSLISADLPLQEKLFSLLPASASARLAFTQALDSKLSWVVLSRQVTLDQRQALESLRIPGLGFEVETSRIYLEGTSSAHLTGFVGKDAAGHPTGYFGLEGYYNRQLTGKDGRIWEDRDAFNRPILISASNRILPQAGNDLYTSIDRTLMFIVYEKLKQGMARHQSLAGQAVLMDTATGRILAMVSLPGYSQSEFFKSDPNLYRNPVISETYEPGSTFKAIVMASALDAGVVTPSTVCTICSGPVTYSGMKISSWDNKYYPNSLMSDIILHSDNVGMTFVSRKLGKQKLYEYLTRFGFNQPTGIDLQEETAVPLRSPLDWQDIDWATISFGQGIAVTPIQLLAGINALANQGVWVAPSIVTKIASSKDQKTVNPPRPNRIISAKAAAQITEMMINGVNKGPVRQFKPDGYLIAGKTGTAQVPISGHYDADNVISSFVGFAPAYHPKFTLLVLLKQPNSTDWGSATAAPIWFEIAKEVFRYYQIPPEINK